MNEFDRQIKKLPFNGCEKNLIDSFYIVGYEESFINEIIIPNISTVTSYTPTIINSITCSEVEKISNESLYIKLIYPKNPEIYLQNNLSTDSNIAKTTSNVIFSFSFDNEKGTSMSSYSGYAYLFYEIYTYDNVTLFLPKSFITISKFPYFTLFKTISKNVYEYFLKRTPDTVPIEIILFNLINYTPSPLNSNLILDFFPHDVLSTQYTINQLSGYPIVDFNLSQVFNLLQMNFFLEIYLFSLFEIDMIFFSKNLEVLNIIMYIIYILNYPCNDTIYLWHIVSFTKEDLLTPNHQTGMFVDKLCTMIIGVNSAYEEDINPRQFKNYFVVDLDNKKLIYKAKESYKKSKSNNVNTTNEDMLDLQKYFQKIIKNKSVQSVFIEKHIKNLMDQLNHIGLGSFMMNATMLFSGQAFKPINFFEYDDKIQKKNRLIQETFYAFYLGLLSSFYSKYTISYEITKTSLDNTDKETVSNRLYYYKYDNDNKDLGKEEMFLVKLFQETNKFSNYFINFVKYFIYKESYNIPLIISEELINIQLNKEDKNKNNNTYGLFDLIDGFYTNSQSKRYNLMPSEKVIEYNKFYLDFYAALSKDYYSNKASKGICLNKKILLKYINGMNNQMDNLKEKLFISYLLLRANNIKTTFSLDIIDIIEEGMTQMNFIDSEILLLTSLILIFSIAQFSCDMLFSVTTLKTISSLITKHPFRRKCAYLLLIVYYRNIKGYRQVKGLLNPDKSSVRISMTNYYVLHNFIMTNHIIPNESMLTLMSSLKREMEEIVEENNNDNEEYEEMTDKYLCPNEIELYYNDALFTLRNESVAAAVSRLTTARTIEFNLDNRKKRNIAPKVRIRYGNEIVESELFSPVNIKHICEELFDKYLASLRKGVIEEKDMRDVLVTMIYYIKIFPKLEVVKNFLLIALEINLGKKTMKKKSDEIDIGEENNIGLDALKEENNEVIDNLIESSNNENPDDINNNIIHSDPKQLNNDNNNQINIANDVLFLPI